MGAEAVASGAEGILVSVLSLRDTRRELLLRLLLLLNRRLLLDRRAWCWAVRLESRCADFVVYCQRLLVSRTNDWAANRCLTRCNGRGLSRGRRLDGIVRPVRLGPGKRHGSLRALRQNETMARQCAEGRGGDCRRHQLIIRPGKQRSAQAMLQSQKVREPRWDTMRAADYFLFK